MSKAMKSIVEDFEAFYRRVENYRLNINDQVARKDDCKAAYEGLYLLNQRIKNDLKDKDLEKKEKRVCHNLLDDCYLKGLLELRVIATHIKNDVSKKSGTTIIYSPSGPPVKINAEVSANSLFSDNIYEVANASSGVNTIDHLKYLNAAKHRIAKELDKLH
jgi:hypothetical protein